MRRRQISIKGKHNNNIAKIIRSNEFSLQGHPSFIFKEKFLESRVRIQEKLVNCKASVKNTKKSLHPLHLVLVISCSMSYSTMFEARIHE